MDRRLWIDLTHSFYYLPLGAFKALAALDEQFASIRPQPIKLNCCKRKRGVMRHPLNPWVSCI